LVVVVAVTVITAAQVQDHQAVVVVVVATEDIQLNQIGELVHQAKVIEAAAFQLHLLQVAAVAAKDR
jgi:hypothetical protein